MKNMYECKIVSFSLINLIIFLLVYSRTLTSMSVQKQKLYCIIKGNKKTHLTTTSIKLLISLI